MIKVMPEFDSWSLEEKISFEANAIAYFAIQNGRDNVVSVENEVVNFTR